ncbi:MAG: aldolase/citrate lyase family protein, partial [Chloroflexota bacterium]|nr:aldolase/citrate lyase family protein [Chloroflexota bacterium]
LIEVVEAAGRNIDAVVIPKCYGAEDILFVDRFLSQIEENMGFEIGRIKLEVLIESADAVLHAEQIAKATPRMGGLIFGLVDFAGDIGAQELGGEQFFYYNYAKAKCIVAARAAGITVVDGVITRPVAAMRRWARAWVSTASGPFTPPRSRSSTRSTHPPPARSPGPNTSSKSTRRPMSRAAWARSSSTTR